MAEFDAGNCPAQGSDIPDTRCPNEAPLCCRGPVVPCLQCSLAQFQERIPMVAENYFVHRHAIR